MGMGKKSRGREPLVRCEACGRRVPRDKTVDIIKGSRYDIGDQKDVIIDTSIRRVYYCISCGKHRHIFEIKKNQAIRNKERKEGGY
jgi:ribosomal protein S26